MDLQRDNDLVLKSKGSRVRIRASHRAPYAGQYGIIESVDEGDSRGPYLVYFEDGIQFRYTAHEIEVSEASSNKSLNHFLGKL